LDIGEAWLLPGTAVYDVWDFDFPDQVESPKTWWSLIPKVMRLLKPELERIAGDAVTWRALGWSLCGERAHMGGDWVSGLAGPPIKNPFGKLTKDFRLLADSISSAASGWEKTYQERYEEKCQNASEELRPEKHRADILRSIADALA
jgi:hypothetical protein